MTILIAYSIVLTPALFILVSISINIPIVVSSVDAISEMRRTFSKLSTQTLISASFDNLHILFILSGVTIWLVIKISLIPPDTITSASDTFAEQIPLTVPPASICIKASLGVFKFLPC